MADFTNFDIKMFEKAREIAETSDFLHFHVGCVITYKRHLIGQGSNSSKTRPQQKFYNKKYRNFSRKDGKPCVHAVHAEIAALNSIPYPVAQQINWREVHVYTYRISNGRRTGRGLSKSCPACEGALRDRGIRHFYYTGNDSYIYERID